MNRRPVRRQEGATLIEVLVSIIIVVFGLLGLAGMQSRMSLAEVEAFQRTQAILVLNDMVGRINANRRWATYYDTGGAALGTGLSVRDCTTATSTYDFDLCEWNNELLGTSEGLGGSNVGAMQDARGCVDTLTGTMPRQIRVSVVWRGGNPTVAPGATSCGQGSYGNDATRRATTATIELGCLQNDPATGLCVTTFH